MLVLVQQHYQALWAPIENVNVTKGPPLAGGGSHLCLSTFHFSNTSVEFYKEKQLSTGRDPTSELGSRQQTLPTSSLTNARCLSRLEIADRDG